MSASRPSRFTPREKSLDKRMSGPCSVSGHGVEEKNLWVIYFLFFFLYFVDRASQYNLFFFIYNLIHCFSVYVQYLLSPFLYMFQFSQAHHQEV